MIGRLKEEGPHDSASRQSPMRRGLLSKQISDVLGTSERTVKPHRGQVMHKMGVQSPAELGRAVEWLKEIFEAASARPTGSE